MRKQKRSETSKYNGTWLIQTPRGHAVVSVLSRLSENLACENSRFSLLFAAEDVSRTFLRAKRPQRRRARRNGCFRRLKKPSRTHVSSVLRLTQACLPENVVWFLSSNCEAPHKRMQHSWATTPNTVGCYMLRSLVHPVACCCAKFETGQTFEQTTPNISFAP